jgi:hypothetical protein
MRWNSLPGWSKGHVRSVRLAGLQDGYHRIAKRPWSRPRSSLRSPPLTMAASNSRPAPKAGLASRSHCPAQQSSNSREPRDEGPRRRRHPPPHHPPSRRHRTRPAHRHHHPRRTNHQARGQRAARAQSRPGSTQHRHRSCQPRCLPPSMGSASTSEIARRLPRFSLPSPKSARAAKPRISARGAVIKSACIGGDPDHGRTDRRPVNMFMQSERNV